MTRTPFRRGCVVVLFVLLVAGALTWSTRQGFIRWNRILAAARGEPLNGGDDQAGGMPLPGGVANFHPLEIRHFQPVYAVPSDRAPVGGRADALAHEVRLVRDWFTRQLPDGPPRFAADGADISVITTTVPWTAHEIESGEHQVERIAAWLARTEVVTGPAVPMIFLETSARPDSDQACAWTSVDAIDRQYKPLRARARYVVVPMANCSIYPLDGSSWPEGTSYVVAHEATHALGGVDERAPHAIPGSHTNEDARDIIFEAGEDQNRIWDELMLDPGHDDYLGHGNADLVDIRDSELIIQSV